MSKRRAATLAAAVFAVAALPACGGSDATSSAYCDDIGASASKLRAFSEPGALSDEAFADLMDRADTITAEAPGDVKASWTILDQGLHDLDDALSGAGLSMDDLAAMQNGNAPPNMTQDQFQKYSAATERIDTAKLAAAQEKIRADVKSRCGIDLESSTG